jgi:hypothetical protein
MSEMTTTECSQLEKCETTIEHGINTFVEVGEALAEIRNAKLYRASHRTFEAYCDEKWKFSRQRAYQLIDQAKVVRAVADAAGADLSTAVDKITEREARDIKGDLPAVAAEIKSRVERGETWNGRRTAAATPLLIGTTLSPSAKLSMAERTV